MLLSDLQAIFTLKALWDILNTAHCGDERSEENEAKCGPWPLFAKAISSLPVLSAHRLSPWQIVVLDKIQ